MLANRHTEVESPAVSDQTSVPADWYPDPEDESQYRYWDGSAWTEHRARRHLEPTRLALRGTNRLIGDSFRTLRRQWRGCAVVASVSIVAGLLLSVLFLYSADQVLMGELDEVWARISAQSFDPTTPENEAYFESLEFDFSIWNFVPAVLGLLITWLAYNLMTAAAALLALVEQRGELPAVSTVLRKAAKRIPRLVGVDLQILALAIAAMAVLVLAAATVPLTLIVLIPVLLAATFLAFPVYVLAYIVASLGPAQSSLKCAYHLARRHFWGTYGRALLIVVIITLVSLASATVTGLLGLPGILADLLNGTVSAVLALLFGVATAVIYLDLGGETDEESEAHPDQAEGSGSSWG